MTLLPATTDHFIELSAGVKLGMFRIKIVEDLRSSMDTGWGLTSRDLFVVLVAKKVANADRDKER
jgi:hypothetical protein